MLSNWLTRGGVVQVVTPDVNLKVKEQEEADHGTVSGLLEDLFSVIAPDPKFSSIKEDTILGDQQQHVQCVHCQNWTPIVNPVMLTQQATTIDPPPCRTPNCTIHLFIYSFIYSAFIFIHPYRIRKIKLSRS